ncbi:hypothetical protein FQN53_003902 [Emmonsiellopsis sp. PD_33]|nr:hypothetical protein FQN53_003902 [Emmonsiellopsis sp. PD_33]
MNGDPQAQKGVQPLIDEARQLVEALNAPGNAAVAKSIQERLQALQKSDAGWAIADGLLASDNSNARFFGALTLTIKIHQDWDNLGEEKAKGLLVHLIDRFILLISRDEAAVTMRKFLTTMTTFFFKPGAPWTHCIRHVAISMANRKYLPETQCTEQSFDTLALPALSYEHMLPLLSFSTTLAEESSRHTLNGGDLRDRLGTNTRDALRLVEFVLQQVSNWNGDRSQSPLSGQLNKLATGAMKSLHAWLVALRADRLSLPELSSSVAVSLDYSVSLLAAPDLAETSMELLIEILSNHPKLLGRERMTTILQFLSGNFGEKYVVALLNGDYEDDTMRFLDLLLRYATTEQTNLLTGQLDEQNQRVLRLLHTLFHGPGFVEVDDKASTLLLEYWTEAADDLVDSIMQGDVEVAPDRVKGEFAGVISDCYDKLRYPDPTTLKEWDDDDVKNFNSFRRDFADFLLATYPLLGFELIQSLVKRATDSMNQEAWESFEVAIFCLAFLADSIAEDYRVDSVFHNIFLSDVFDDICFNRRAIPVKPRQTLLDMVARYTVYFERNHNLLPRVLNLLFNSLDAPSCDQAASKSISFLCQNCRQALPMYVDDFINRFDQLRSNVSVNSTTLERVAEGIAAVIQACPADPTKATCLIKLLNPLHQFAQQAQQQAQYDYEEALVIGLKAMRCTAAIGKGFRAPDEAVIDLESESSNQNNATAKQFWTSDPLGSMPQACLVQILDILMSTFPTDSDILEATCDVLKAGYTEHTPGPYVLPPEVTTRFVKSANVTSPRFPTIMGTASAFLASHSAHPSTILPYATELIMHVYELMNIMTNQPQHYDPDVAHSLIDFLHLLLPKYKHAFYSLLNTPPQQTPTAPIPTILTFTLHTLKSPDPLPLRSACAFWATLLALPDLPPDLQPTPNPASATNHLFNNMLTTLSAILIRQISGHCARSDLDHLAEVLKKFVFHHQGLARGLLGGALAGLEEENAHAHAGGVGTGVGIGGGGGIGASKVERERFLASVLALRGARGTNKVVKEYWVLCRGRGFGYAR